MDYKSLKLYRLKSESARYDDRSYQRFDEYMVIAPEFVPDEP